MATGLAPMACLLRRQHCELQAASRCGQLAGGEVAVALAELGMLTTCTSGLTVSAV
jgi:hypothetical protein